MENDPSDMKGWKKKARDFITAHENDDWGMQQPHVVVTGNAHEPCNTQTHVYVSVLYLDT